MRIGLDVHVLGGRPQGTVTVWETLLGALPPEHQYVLFSFDPALTRARYPQAHFEHERIPLHFAPARIALAYPLLARRAGCDVFHVNYFGPPAGAPGLVVSMHDVLYLDFPTLVPRARRAQFRVLAGLTARHARHVITGSEYSRARIAHHFGVPAERVSVVPYGMSDAWTAPDEAGIAAAWERIRARVPARFTLSVGRLEPRKNHLVAARLAARLVDDGLVDGLVLVGSADFGDTALFDALGREGLARHVTHLEGVSLAELQALYRRASALTFLSAAEGFGLPLLEAMAMGTPILAADRTALPEVCAGAGLLADPDDDAATLDAGRRLLRDAALRERLRAAGTRRVRQFTPARMVAGTIAAYERARAS